MTFCKYGFSQDIWEQLKPTIQNESGYINCAVVEIGELNGLYAVDIMWFDSIPETFSTYEVFPDPIGVHTFAGCEELYTQRFCEFNPLSPFCNEAI